MKSYDQDQLLAIKNRYDEMVLSLPGVARTSIGLSRSGDAAYKVYTDRNAPARTRQQVVSMLPADVPVEFEELGPGDEVIPYAAGPGSA